MQTAAVLVAIFTALFLPLMMMLIFWGDRWRAAQDKARARRLADARMNARLLRFNI